MSWVEQESKSRVSIDMTPEKAQELDKAKQEVLPEIQKEADSVRPFEPVDFQAVISPGIYEGEFGVKGDDIIFHFWPYGYHEADRAQKALPRFLPKFQDELTRVMTDLFERNRVQFCNDKDVGALSVKATNWGSHQFARDLSIRACETLHKALGGES